MVMCGSKPFVVYAFSDSPFGRYQSKVLRLENISELLSFYRFLLLSGYLYDYMSRTFYMRDGRRFSRVLAFTC